MSAYIPHYQHDILVSYAQIDNEPLTEADKGWVTTLITTLQKLLGQKLGRSAASSLWMPIDTPLVTPDSLQETATVLIILSPGYVTSLNTVELETFLQQLRAQSKRIFLIEKDWVEWEQQPPDLHTLSRYPFWVTSQATKNIHTLGMPRPNPDREPEYYERLDDLARDLATYFKTLKDSQAIPPTVAVSSPPKPTAVIFLAEVTDELTRARDQVKRYLEQHGLQVLPRQPYYFHTATDLQQALIADLQKSDFFVQLLSDSLPQRPNWMTTPVSQWEQAKRIQGLSMLQWRQSPQARGGKPPTVFITYSGESKAHAERVLALSDRLRANGIDCDIDQYYMNAAEGWARWIVKKVHDSDYVLVACTQADGVTQAEGQGVAKGLKWGSAIIADAIYGSGQNDKFIPIYFSPAEKIQVPEFLLTVTQYEVSTTFGYEELYRRLTGQPAIEKLGLGNPIPNATYRALFENCITEMPLEEFQQYVIQQLAEKQRLAAAARIRAQTMAAGPRYSGVTGNDSTGCHSVFVNAYSEDKELANQIGKLLSQQHGMICFQPRTGGNPQELRDDLKGHFSECDAVLIVYGKSPLRWIDSQLRLFFKLAGRRQPRPYLALCEAPPIPKESLEVTMPFDIPVLDCSKPSLEDNLRTFISQLEAPL